MKVSRRKFLGISAGTAAVAFGAYVVFSHALERGSSRGNFKSLSPEEADVISRLIDDLLDPSSTGFPIDKKTVLARMDEFLSALPPSKRRMIKGGIQLIQHGTLASRFMFKPYTRLDKSDRLKYLSQWENSKFTFKRQIFAGIKMFIGLFVFAIPENSAFIGVVKECGG